ncbi:MAG: hypothetical protein U0790_20775 [Isosphaeraceae bacterium]
MNRASRRDGARSLGSARRAARYRVELLENRQLLSVAIPDPNPVPAPEPAAALVSSPTAVESPQVSTPIAVDAPGSSASATPAAGVGSPRLSPSLASLDLFTVRTIRISLGGSPSSGETGSLGDSGSASGGSLASRVLASVLRSQGMNPGAAASAPDLARLFRSLPVRIIVTSRDPDSGVAPSGHATSPGTSDSSGVVDSSSSVVVIVVVGRGRVLLILPMATSNTLTATSSQPAPVQPDDSSLPLLDSQLTVFSRFGQSELASSSLVRPRLASDYELSALFDLVEPSPPAIERGAPPAAPGGNVGGNLTSWWWPLVGPAQYELPESPAGDQDLVRGPRDGRSGSEDATEAQEAGLAPRVVAAGALAGVACTISLRESRSRSRGAASTGRGTGFRPTVGRRSFPGR